MVVLAEVMLHSLIAVNTLQWACLPAETFDGLSEKMRFAMKSVTWRPWQSVLSGAAVAKHGADVANSVTLASMKQI
ncbi:MAG: hypothetical protein H7327_14355 [Herminiimonas sp.]|nr:hypothetical protein [Herminiimonas sp.]